MEKRDGERASDLRQLGRHYQCANYEQTEADRAISPTYCDNAGASPPDLKDPLTDEPYRYNLESDARFTVCATFETDPTELRPGLNLTDGLEGCMVYVRKSPEDRWRIE